MIYEELEGYDNLIKIVMSDALKESEYCKIIVSPIEIKKKTVFQVERFKNNQVFHINLQISGLKDYLDENEQLFRQVNIFFAGITLTLINGKNGVYRKVSSNTLKPKMNLSHNKSKKYIFEEGEDIPALRELGVFDKNNAIIKSKYDKFKQINRFVEIIDDYFDEKSLDDVTILDFGSGKSYLTFVVYYYFAVKKKKNVKIIGYDLKKDVVDHCNEIAKRYGYASLNFVHADVSRDVLYQDKIDIVISLHACNTATDYALNYALSHNVKYIFSVPCCQHEINSTIKNGGDLDLLLKYGIIKERVSALLTDSLRAETLEAFGYKVDVMEFVDLAHSPKNLMIRAKRVGKKNLSKMDRIKLLQQKYGFNSTLLDIISKE